MTCSPFDVVVPFPQQPAPLQTPQGTGPVRPDFQPKNASTLLMMITSANRSAWHLDVSIEQWREAGLRKPCFARMKLFTLDNGLIHDTVGRLGEKDQRRVIEALRAAMPLHLPTD